MEQPGAFLSRWTSESEHQRWPLPADRDAATIGRAETADVHVADDSQVSRVHARLERVGGQWTIVDDGLSRNGTFVNGRRLTHRVRLADRDTVTVGQTVLTFCAPPAVAADLTVAGDGLPAVTRLTEAQRGVLVALCRPCVEGGPYAAAATNQMIAQELSLSVEGVKTHLRVLFHKFGIEDLPQNRKRARLVELSLRWGLVSDDS